MFFQVSLLAAQPIIRIWPHGDLIYCRSAWSILHIDFDKAGMNGGLAAQ